MKHLRCVLLCVVCASVLAASSAWGTTYEVKPDGTGDRATIQDAINDASGGDTIELTDGVFRGDGNRDLNFWGKAITIRSQGGAEACTLDCEGSDVDPHWGFEFFMGEGPASVIEGITIMNAYKSYGGKGAGIYCRNSSSPTINDCIITGNTATYGAGIYCSNCSPAITNCTITGNSQTGIECSSASPEISRCTISGNSTDRDAGGIACYTSSPTIEFCTISDNTAGWAYKGGGIYCGGSSPTIDSCTITGNTAGYGGGIYCRDLLSSPEITRCTITDNNAGGGGPAGGGGICCRDSASVTIHDCIICRNYADGGTSWAYGGGIWFDSPGTLQITCCKIAGNFTVCDLGSCGGGIACDGGSAQIQVSTITGNRADEGGGIYCYGSSVGVAYCTISADSALQGGGIKCTAGSDVTLVSTILWCSCSSSSTTQGDEAYCVSGCSLTFARCCDVDTTGIQGLGAVDWSSPDNIFEDPLWVAPAACTEAPTDSGDFHLQAGSPCRAENSPEGCGRIGALGDQEMASVGERHSPEPARFCLEPNIPNPFRPATEIRYGIPAGPGISRVDLRIYDTRGRCVRTLVDADQSPGVHAVTWDGTDDYGRKVASGVYFCHARWSGQSATLRMVLLR